MTETTIVTGGAGFIGSHIAERLLRDGQRVRIVDNFSTGRAETIAYLESLGGDLQVHQVSITDADALAPIFAGVDTVYHHAALASVPHSIREPLESHEHCATGTLNVLVAARDAGVRRVVYAASAAAYGNVEGEITTEARPSAPISPYGAAKLAAEHYCQAFTYSYGLETVCLRYFNVFGPRQDPKSQYAAVIPLFISAMLRGEAPTVFGDGLQSRDFTYVDNVVQGNLLAARAPDAVGQVMNLATGQSVTLLYLIERLNVLLGTEMQPNHAPARPGDIRESRASIARAAELMGYAPVVDFETGLARTLAYYRGQA